MQFRTCIKIKPSNYKINIGDSIFLIGSCFSENIRDKLDKNKFKINNQVLGVYFNPPAIFNILHHSVLKKPPHKNTYIEKEALCFNEMFHSSIYRNTMEELQNHINNNLLQIHKKLITTKYLIITLGTSIVYINKKTNNIVGNCHKLPQKHFIKKTISPEEIVEGFDKLWKTLKTLNPNIRYIITISPVRHIKNDLISNSLSKSILKVATNLIEKKYDNVAYFPSYEILQDDLRDYRFYDSDMIHPSKIAIDYIWEKFCEAYFDDETKKFIEEWQSIQKYINHRPRHLLSKSTQEATKAVIKKIKSLNFDIDFTKELLILNKLLISFKN